MSMRCVLLVAACTAVAATVASDAAAQRPTSQVVPEASVRWMEAPRTLLPAAKMAILSGDPGRSDIYVIRLQLPAGYRITAHTHPSDEHVTVLSGTFALGLGEEFSESALKDLATGGYAMIYKEMPHFAVARTEVTLQIHGVGPYVHRRPGEVDPPQ